MKNIKYVTQQIPCCQVIVCDVCKKEFDYNRDMWEYQEVVTVQLRGGFGSIFGDGAEYECDICQYCLEELLGKYLRCTNCMEDENEDHTVGE